MLGRNGISSGGWTSLLRFGVGGSEVDGLDSDVGQCGVEVVEAWVGSVVLLEFSYMLG